MKSTTPDALLHVRQLARQTLERATRESRRDALADRELGAALDASRDRLLFDRALPEAAE